MMKQLNRVFLCFILTLCVLSGCGKVKETDNIISNNEITYDYKKSGTYSQTGFFSLQIDTIFRKIITIKCQRKKVLWN